MDRRTFESRLREAATRARDFARTLVMEPLPDAIRVRVFLSASYDGHAKPPIERVYETDRTRTPFECSLEELADELYRDGRVPEWVNLAVAGEDGHTTFVRAECCGRFVEDDAWLYHREEGRPPFHVLGPAMPPRHEGDARYSVHAHTTCVTPADLADLSRVAERVRILTIHRGAASRNALSTLAKMPRMLALTIYGATIDDVVLETFARHDSLMRVQLSMTERLAVDTRRADSLYLESLECSADMLVIDGRLPPSLQRLTLSAARLDGDLELPPLLDSLGLHVSNATDDAISRWARSLRDASALDLRGTPIGGALARELVDRLRPRFVDLAQTRVTDVELHAIARAHPDLELRPPPA